MEELYLIQNIQVWTIFVCTLFKISGSFTEKYYIKKIAHKGLALCEGIDTEREKNLYFAFNTVGIP
jgi:hypothetical protein